MKINNTTNYQKNNSPAFGSNIKLSKGLLERTNISDKIMILGFRFGFAARDGRNMNLGIYTADNVMFGEITDKKGKSLASKIPTSPKVNPEDYFNVPRVVMSIYENAVQVFDNLQKK